MKPVRIRIILLLLVTVLSARSNNDGAVILNGYSRTCLQLEPGTETYGAAWEQRFKLDLLSGDNIRTHAESSLRFSSGSLNAAGYLESAGLTPDEELNNTSSGVLYIDHAWTSAQWDWLQITTGKIPLARGSAWLLNPTDRVNPRNRSALFSEDTAGIPALTADMTLGYSAGISSYLTFMESGWNEKSGLDFAEPENMPFGVLGKVYFNNLEMTAGFSREAFMPESNNNPGESWRKEYRILSDITFDMGEFGFTGEAAYYLEDANQSEIRENLELSAGTTVYVPLIETEIMTEYIHLGQGEKKSDNYDASVLLNGTGLLLAEDYLFLRLSKEVIPEVTLEFSTLHNLNDFSSLVLLSTDIEPVTDIVINALVMMTAGESEGEFRRDYYTGSEHNWTPWNELLLSLGVTLYF